MLKDWSSAPAPRLCHVVKWNENDGFGFHLLADKKRKVCQLCLSFNSTVVCDVSMYVAQGQFIGKVDPGSAAEAAGLRLGDRIVQVNGHNVVDESHKEVVQRIKAVANETKLLVIDPNGQLFYAERNITITPSMPNVQKMRTPDNPPVKNNRPKELQLLPTNGGPPPRKSSPKVCQSSPLLFVFHSDNSRCFKQKFVLKKKIYIYRTLVQLLYPVCATSSNGERMQATDFICWPIRSALVSVSLLACFFKMSSWKKLEFLGLFLFKKGHFIGKVDANTPASAAGLKVSDRIIEVNGHNVVNETHKQVS